MDLFTVLFGGGFALGGLVCILIAIIQRANAKVAESWPTAPGQILSSGLQAVSSYSSSGSSSTNYAPAVEYTYTIMGQSYTGYQLAFGNVRYDYNTAARKVAPYPQGAQVTVHYDPANPTNAVLEPRAAGSVIFFILGFAFLAVGILAFIFLPTLQQYAS